MSSKPIKHRFSIFSVFLTFFIDTLGVTIIFPIFAPLFLSAHKTILSPDLSYNLKAAVLGLFLAAYPLSQLIFAPIIGEFADRYGRKKAFLITTLLTFLGYVLCALSIKERWIYPLFFSRLLMGASAGNLSLCLSAIADLSHSKKERVRYYGLGSVIAGVTFVLGPFIGGKLSDSLVHPLFNLAFPMWIGAGLALVNWIFLLFAFVETLHEVQPTPFDFMKGFRNLQTAFKTQSIQRLYVIYFFYLLSWNMLFQFIPAFLVTNFSATNSLIGDVSAIMGFCWVVGSVLLYRIFLHHFKMKNLLLWGSSLFFLGVVVCAFMYSLFPFVALLGGSVAIASFGWPLCTGAISTVAPQQMQGKILGLSQSVQSLAMIIAPIVVGPFLSKGSGVPFFIAAGFSAIFGILVSMTKFQEHFHE